MTSIFQTNSRQAPLTISAASHAIRHCSTKKIREIPEREIAVTFFLADKRKSGGAYLTTCGFVKKIDEIERVLVLTSGEEIPLDDIFDIDFSDEQQTGAPDN
ncbi:MAG: hypothetical protein ACI4JZ_10300 [Oscillospiraceae bacterium]